MSLWAFPPQIGLRSQFLRSPYIINGRDAWAGKKGEQGGGGTGEGVLLAGLRALGGMEMLWMVNPSFGDLA